MTLRSSTVGPATLVVVCVAAVLGSTLLHLTGSTAFQPYYGPIHPVLGTSLVGALAIASLRWLQADGRIFVDRPGKGPRRFAIPAGVATVLAVPVVVVDLAGGFPEDLNVLPPQSLLFYPVIALVAETVFHLAPLALLVFAATRVSGRDREKLLLGCLIAVALPEPVFQVVLGAGQSPPWANAYVAVHLLVFNLFAVSWLWRYGFLSSLTFRLVYYVWWHLTWGYLRLRVLF